MPADGGVAKRLTFLGARTSVVGWSSDGKSVLFASNCGQPFKRIFNLYEISPSGVSRMPRTVILPRKNTESCNFSW